MFIETTQKQIRNFGKDCIASLNSNMTSMNPAQMNDFYERANPPFNSERKSRKSKKQA